MNDEMIKEDKKQHHFNSDLINNMDHMRISGNGPSSVIFSQTKKFKKWKIDALKVPKQAETHKIIISVDFTIENFNALKTLRINQSRSQILAICALEDSLATSSDTHQLVVEI